MRKKKREDANVHKEKSEENYCFKQWEKLLNQIIEEELKTKAK